MVACTLQLQLLQWVNACMLALHIKQTRLPLRAGND